MEAIKVDKESCVACGLCSKACPRGLIVLREGRKTPLPVLGFKSLCIKCGHCVAVCPKAAISIPSMGPEACLPLDESSKASPEQLALFFKSRRSIRIFKKEPLPREALQRILDVADYAPTGLNLRQVSWTVFEKPEEVRALAGMVVDWMRASLAENPELAASFGMDKIVKAWEGGADPVMRGAPHLFIARAKAGDKLAQSSALIALSHLELAVHALGFGACWAGYFNMACASYEPLRRHLAFPEGEICFGAMMAGIPAVSYKRIPARPPLPVSWR